MEDNNLLKIELFSDTYQTICNKLENFSNEELKKIKLENLNTLLGELKTFHKFLWYLMEKYDFSRKDSYKECTDKWLKKFNDIYLEAEIYTFSDEIKTTLKNEIDSYLDNCILKLDDTFLPFLNNIIFLQNLTTGIKLIDAQHKSLFVFIDKFIAKIIDNSSKNDILKIVSYLEKYTEKHFTDEEELMKKSNYDKLSDHLKEHEKFKATINNIKSQINGDNEGLVEAIFTGLNEWLIKHILGSDKEFAKFYHGKQKNQI